MAGLGLLTLDPGLSINNQPLVYFLDTIKEVEGAPKDQRKARKRKAKKGQKNQNPMKRKDQKNPNHTKRKDQKSQNLMKRRRRRRKRNQVNLKAVSLRKKIQQLKVPQQQQQQHY